SNWLRSGSVAAAGRRPTGTASTASHPSLLRKGRFDEIFFVDLPDLDERKNIFTIHRRARKQDAAHFDLDQLATASSGFSGAEIEQAVIASLYRTLHTPLTTSSLLDALRATVPCHSRGTKTSRACAPTPASSHLCRK